jgi:hypothetical protein
MGSRQRFMNGLLSLSPHHGNFKLQQDKRCGLGLLYKLSDHGYGGILSSWVV